tara:strand:- start:5049 stop:6008 length:960 start_codon:yes stop_codon:yes gene_type:complete
MENFVLYTKSYSFDVEVCKRLLDSVIKHNVDDIPFYISVPTSDINLFKNVLGTDGYILIPDEDIYQLYSNLDGWRTQQIVKSHFNTLNISKSYLCLDSDTFFINDFRYNDFLAPDNTIYTLMVEAPLELRIQSEARDNKSYYGICYYRTVREFRKMIGCEDLKRIWMYGPPPYPWDCSVWENFQNFLKENNMNMEQFFIYFEQSTGGALPRESAFYGEFLMKTHTIPIYPTSSWFLADSSPFANEKNYRFFVDRCGEFGSTYVDANFLKKYYLGLGFQDGRTTQAKGIGWNSQESNNIIKKLEESDCEFELSLYNGDIK